MINADARLARARLRAHKRWKPGDDLDQLTWQALDELKRTNSDAGVDDIVATFPRPTAEFLQDLRRLVAVP